MGGSGSAVASALVFLTASGVFENKVKNIHLLIVDAHKNNKATMAAYQNAIDYNYLQSKFNPNKAYSSFAPNIIVYETWDLLVNYSGTRTKRERFALKDLALISRDGNDLNEYAETCARAEMLMKALYTEHEQGQAVLTGFHAHPAIGAACGTAAVLSDNGRSGYGGFVKALQAKLSLGDTQLALVGSLFGGTGASSLSSLVRALHKVAHQPGLPGKLSIAGCFLLKYFAFKEPADRIDPEKKIRKEMFDFGSKNALTYYNESGLLKTSGNDEEGLFDAIYMLGFDRPIERAPYADGDDMDNPASFVEMEAAMAIRDFFVDRTIESSDRNRTFFKAIYLHAQDDVKYYKMSWDTFTKGQELRVWIGKTLKMALLFNMYLYPQIFTKTGGPRPVAFQPFKCYVEGNSDAEPICERLRAFFFRFETWCLQIAESLGEDVTKSDMFNLHQLQELVRFQSNINNKTDDERSLDTLKKYDNKNIAPLMYGDSRNNFIGLGGVIQNRSKKAAENGLAELLQLIYKETKLEV
jgi:hypothetical protein